MISTLYIFDDFDSSMHLIIKKIVYSVLVMELQDQPHGANPDYHMFMSTKGNRIVGVCDSESVGQWDWRRERDPCNRAQRNLKEKWFNFHEKKCTKVQTFGKSISRWPDTIAIYILYDFAFIVWLPCTIIPRISANWQFQLHSKKYDHWYIVGQVIYHDQLLLMSLLLLYNVQYIAIILI